MDYLRVTGLCLLMCWGVGCQKEAAVVGRNAVTTGTISRGLDGRAKSIRFVGGNPTAADMATIRNMPSLEEIHAEAPNLDDDELAVLAQMPSLSVLSLTGTKATGQAIEALVGIEVAEASGPLRCRWDHRRWSETTIWSCGTSCAEAVPHTADGYDCRCDHFVAETGRTVAGRDIHNRSATIATNSRAKASRKLNRLSIGSDSDYRQCHFGAIAEVQ